MFIPVKAVVAQVTLTCPANTATASCLTQAQVNSLFSAWLAKASGTGGCNGVLTNNNTGAPSACGGSTTVTFTYTSSCAPLTTTCQATFTVAPPPGITITCPVNTSTASCLTQAQVNSTFSAWLATASGTGGCNGVLTNNNTGAPSACGGSTTVTFTYTSTCSPLTTTCQATFTVTPPPTVSLICPVNSTTPAGSTQAQVNTAFSKWLATAAATGGCNGVITNNNTGAPAAAGGTTTVMFTYTTSCNPLTTTCQATFTVLTPATGVLAQTTASSPVYTQDFQQQKKLFASDRAVENNIGTAVAISGNYAVVAGSDIPSMGYPNNCNCVYVFEKNSTGDWRQIQKLIAPDNSPKGFGFSVAISGDRIVVGAPNEEGDDKGSNLLVAAGAVYVFERNNTGTWSFTKKLVSTERGAIHQFGYSVSISNARVLIGSPGQAAAYLFERIDANNWKAWCKLVAPDGGGGFGHSVAISGEDIAIGAPTEDKDTTNITVNGGGANPMAGAGAVYMYSGASTDWKKMFAHKLVYWHRSGGEQFGYAVSISNGKMVVGAPFENEDERLENPLINAGAAHVFFKQVNGTWFWDRILTPGDRTTTDNFGISVCISGDMIIVGTATKDDVAGGINLKDAGAAYTFKYFDTRDAAGWRFFQKIVANDRAENDWFGYSVAMDKNNVIVGAPFQDRNDTRLQAENAGAAYIFSKPPCAATTSSIAATSCKIYTSPSHKYTWSKTGMYKDTIMNKVGCDSIITINLTISNKVDTSVTVRGNVMMANVKNATYQWIDCATNQPINITTRSLLATVKGSYKVTIDQDGCIGTSSCHQIVDPRKTTDSTTTPVVTTPPVVLQKFASKQVPFLEVNKIVANDRTHNDEFGRSVSVSGNYAVIGTPYDDEDEKGNSVLRAGSAYIFKLDDGGKWKQLQKISAPDRTPGTEFGTSVAISGNFLVVGSPRDNLGVNGLYESYLAGSAYVYYLKNGTWYFMQKLIANPTARVQQGQAYFGSSVAIDGNTIAIGCPAHALDPTDQLSSSVTSAGAVFVYQLTSQKTTEGDVAGWVQMQKLVARDRQLGGDLGNSVSICGDNIIAGAWQQDYPGPNGNRMDNAGAAYIFERKGITWTQTQKLIADDGTAHDEFGFSVGISGDYAVVGARNVTEKRGDEDNGLYTGNAYVFKRKPGGGWAQQTKIDPEDRTQGDYLGTAVGISGDYLIVSAWGQDTDSLGNYMPDAGAIYVYYLNKKGDWIQSDKISPFYKHQLGHFGMAAAISDCTIIGTAWTDQTDENDENAISGTGAGFVFSASGCNNNGKCNSTPLPFDKTPIDRQIKDSTSNSNMPQKAQSPDLNGKGNEVPIETQPTKDESTNPLKKAKSLLKKVKG